MSPFHYCVNANIFTISLANFETLRLLNLRLEILGTLSYYMPIIGYFGLHLHHILDIFFMSFFQFSVFWPILANFHHISGIFLQLVCFSDYVTGIMTNFYAVEAHMRQFLIQATLGNFVRKIQLSISHKLFAALSTIYDI